MCGSTNWQEEGRKTYAGLLDDLAVGIDESADEDATAPLQREASATDALGILPGVPFF